ncbi:MAG: KilA-N domain-containing protein [Bacteroidales bacterium]|nr:KilA-N domain-containing protein [Bacteroidales bacterium]
MNKKQTINVQGTAVTLFFKPNGNEYICLTDIAKYRNQIEPFSIINNWMRSRSTIEFIGLWELLNNPNFKPLEFERFRTDAGSNYFVLSPQRWIEATNAIGIISKSGRYGGTYAHEDIAFEFASWISSEFKLYLVTEFKRFKQQEQKNLNWSAKRELAKINYHIHTSAIKQNLIPDELTPQQTSIIYASEADVLNVALFGITAKLWREANPEKDGNMRDYASISELICLSNMENLNAVFISEGLSQKERLVKLNHIAIRQMQILTGVENRKLLN